MTDIADGREECWTIQPAADSDHPGAKLPYPFHVFISDGSIGRQDVWRGEPSRLVGFAAVSGAQAVDLEFTDWVAGDPERAVGMYGVYVCSGDLATARRPIVSVQRDRARRTLTT